MQVVGVLSGLFWLQKGVGAQGNTLNAARNINGLLFFEMMCAPPACWHQQALTPCACSPAVQSGLCMPEQGGSGMVIKASC